MPEAHGALLPTRWRLRARCLRLESTEGVFWEIISPTSFLFLNHLLEPAALPELPEVETIMRALRHRLDGRRFLAVEQRRRTSASPCPWAFRPARRPQDRGLRPAGQVYRADAG
jgi:hypothetical protein